MSLTVEFVETSDLGGRELFRLVDDFTVSVCDGFEITVPRGFVTNFGSVPRFFHRIIRPVELRSASVVHDYLLNELPEFQTNHLPVRCSRWIADAVLFELLIRNDFGTIKAFAVWLAVRVYGILKK